MISMAKAITPIIEHQQSDSKQLEASIALKWAEYQQADRQRTAKGLDFGKACYELREQTKAQGSRTGEGFTAALDKLGVSKPTAYRWINRYAQSAGLRITRDEVGDWADVMPDPQEGFEILATCADIMLLIQPSTNAGFYFVTAIDSARWLAFGLRKPIRKDAIASCLSDILAMELSEEELQKVYTPEEFNWMSKPFEPLAFNCWLAA